LSGLAVVMTMTAEVDPSFACRPGPNADITKSPAENFAKYNVVFVGQVIAEDKPEGRQTGGRFRVIKHLKGGGGDEIGYRTTTSSCQFRYRVGSIMLIFAKTPEDGRITLSAISPARLFKNEREALDFVRDNLPQ